MSPAPTADDERIDLHDEDSLQRWMQHFGVTQSQLEEAVLAAGDRVRDVDEHLRNQGASAGAS